MGREISVAIPHIQFAAGIVRQSQVARFRIPSLAASIDLGRTLQDPPYQTTIGVRASSCADQPRESSITEGFPARHCSGSSSGVPRTSSTPIQNTRDAETTESVHNFRNILNIVSLLSELALSKLPDTSPACESIRHITAACADANDLCNQMLENVRNTSEEPGRVDFSQLVRDITPLLIASVPTRSELQIDLADNIPPASISARGMRQVIINLVKNAAEALGERAGTVTVRTGTTELTPEDRNELPFPGTSEKSPYSYIEVSDTGCGMPESTRARLFEATFTTKKNGHGLGTASIGRIVRRSRGIIQVQSEVGTGTIIRVLFPSS